MTLSITVGLEPQMRQHPETAAAVDLINRMLVDAGLPPHEEPVTVPDDAQWRPADLPYTFWDRLQRLQAWANQRGELPPPLQDGADARHDSVIEDEIAMLDSHVVLHSAEGFYVPAVFDEPMVDDQLPGRILGSSQRLMQDLQRSGRILGITADGGRLPAAVIEEIHQADRSQHPYAPERSIWLAMYDAARRSIQHHALIYHG
jgi:hypothetical protein